MTRLSGRIIFGDGRVGARSGGAPQASHYFATAKVWRIDKDRIGKRIDQAEFSDQFSVLLEFDDFPVTNEWSMVKISPLVPGVAEAKELRAGVELAILEGPLCVAKLVAD